MMKYGDWGLGIRDWGWGAVAESWSAIVRAEFQAPEFHN